MMQFWVNSATGERLPQRPQRIRLSDGSTRTNEDITDEQLAENAWVLTEFETYPGPHAMVDPDSTTA